MGDDFDNPRLRVTLERIRHCCTVGRTLLNGKSTHTLEHMHDCIPMDEKSVCKLNTVSHVGKRLVIILTRGTTQEML